MQLLENVKSNVFLCGVEISFNGEALPSAIPNWGNFYNTITTDANFFKLILNIASIEFGESSKESKAGTSYVQSVKFRVRNGDMYRSERIALFGQVKFLKLILNNNAALFIGRNDYSQNALPKKKIEANAQMFEYTFQVESISPAGYTPTHNIFGLPTLLPLTLKF